MSIELEDRVRHGLHRLVDAEAATPFDVDALVREGRRRRRTRRLAAIAGLTAAALGITTLAMGMPRPSSSDAVGSGPSVQPTRQFDLPDVAAGEIARVVLPGDVSAPEVVPVAGMPYVIRAACWSTDPTAMMKAEVNHVGGPVLLSFGTATCDGAAVDTASGTIFDAGEPVVLHVEATAGTAAYAVLVPSLNGSIPGEIARVRLPGSSSQTVQLQGGVPFAVRAACAGADDDGVAFQVLGGRSGHGEVRLSGTVRCDGVSRSDGFTYTVPEDGWATIRLVGTESGQSGFVILVQPAPS